MQSSRKFGLSIPLAGYWLLHEVEHEIDEGTWVPIWKRRVMIQFHAPTRVSPA